MIVWERNRTRWLSLGVLLMVVAGACGQDAASTPEGDGAVTADSGRSASDSVPPATSSLATTDIAAGGPPWYSVAGGAPEISGAVRKVNSPLEEQNWIDDAVRFQRAWAYTGRVRLVTVDVNRADPAVDRCDEMRGVERGVRSVGHLVVSLQGIGDGGIAIVDRTKKGTDGQAVRTYACSGNAIVSVVMLINGVVTNEADLTARSPGLIAALAEVLDDLRPR